jgi:UDP-N-acetylglucosamine 1-carboxyvinyltransferase
MKKLIINGGNKLQGTINIAGAKNATLPLMAMTILTDEPIYLSNIPHVSDIANMSTLLTKMGIDITLDGSNSVVSDSSGYQGRVLKIQAKNITDPVASYEIVCKMRASIFILGPLLARIGKAKVSLPGGCAIGNRPVDLHLKAMERLGAKIDIVGGYIEASAENGLTGAEIHFEKISVGATENAMMAATLAIGETIITNAACEPEIIDLALCLNKMGAKISGAGTPQIKIIGVDKLTGASHRVIPDRIEAGTYAIASIITNGSISLQGVEPWLFGGFKEELEFAGGSFTNVNSNSILVKRRSDAINSINISTHPFPGFPTDMQAQFMALMSVSQSTSVIEENIFENRFMHIAELCRMGANIEARGKIAVIKGVENLNGAEVMATDLRASVGLVLAALVAKGQTIISNLHHLERGYERLTEKLIFCGADIKIIY